MVGATGLNPGCGIGHLTRDRPLCPSRCGISHLRGRLGMVGESGGCEENDEAFHGWRVFACEGCLGKFQPTKMHMGQTGQASEFGKRVGSLVVAFFARQGFLAILPR